jgi:dTDP-4-amino-4,6-dideoxygalactose transaminase
MITTNSEKVYNICKSLRNHGLELQGSNWTFERIGFSAKMNELEAIVGLQNLSHVISTIYKRRTNFTYLEHAFMLNKFFDYFTTMKIEPNCTISPHAFPIIVKESSPFSKEDFVNFLNAKGIDNRNLFYSIPTQCKSYKKYITGSYTEAEFCSNNGTHIGIHQDLSLEQLDYITNSIKEFLNLFT